LALASGAGIAAPRLLVLGDSLSAGYGIPEGAGWVALLTERLVANGHPHRVINASITGDTTAGGLRRLPPLLDEYAPDVVIVELGANDGLRGLPLGTVRTNLQRTVSLARARARAVLLVGVRMPPNYGPRYVDALAELYREVAEAEQVPLVPALLAGVGERLDLMQADGLHPLPAAQPLLLDNVWPQLVPLLAAGG